MVELNLHEYNLFIESIFHSRENVWFEGSERHHIIPRCVGGSDDPENLIYLNYEEHYEAHRILARDNPHIKGFQYALWRMSNDGRIINSEQYAESRKYFVRTHKEFMTVNNPMSNASSREKLSNSRKGIEFSEEHRQHISESRKGKPNWVGKTHREESKLAMSYSHMKEYRKKDPRPVSDIGRRNMSEAKKGEKNPMYGIKACWINNGSVNKRIPVENLSEYPTWRRGRISKKEVLL